MYFEPWLWFDGDQHGGFDFYMWESMVASRMNDPAPVTIRFWGDYTPTDGSGTVYVQFRNDSTAAINGNAFIAITEDSLFYPAPNGRDWHCHVPRDYLPDHMGTSVSIPAGDSVVVSQAFTIDGAWNENMCKILAWVQDGSMQADSTYEIWQGGLVNVLELGVAEQEGYNAVFDFVRTYPNPCKSSLHFSFSLPVGTAYSITFYDITGRKVNTLSGHARRELETILWDREGNHGMPIHAGVYFYSFTSSVISTTGKIVVQ